MHVEIAPHPALLAHVDRIWVSASLGASQMRRILPDGCIDIIVDAKRGSAVVVGTMTRAKLHAPVENERLVAVRFRPGGATGFVEVGANQIRDRVLNISDLGLAWLAPDPIATAGDLPGAARELQRQLLTRLRRVGAPHPLVEFATRRLYSAEPPTITSLEGATGASRQHLARLFKTRVGVSPKRLARIARMQRAVAVLDQSRSLATTAASLGYTDEAHMARDFRELTGLTPGQTRAALGSIFPIRSLLEAP